MSPLLAGKRAIVTGASRGLGAVIAEALYGAGAELLLVARSKPDLLELREQLLVPGGGAIHTLAADLVQAAAPQTILTYAREIWPHADILVNNAGMIGPIGMAADNDWAEWRDTLQVNLIAPAELSKLMVSWMREVGKGGSIVNLSGGGATSPRPRFSAYATAKCGLARFTETLAVEVSDLGIRVNSVAPGAMKTKMLQDTLDAGPERTGAEEYEKIRKFAAGAAADPKVAADLVVYLASEKGAGITGKLISAAWDPWQDLDKQAGQLMKSDVYTLRRIVPEDRMPKENR